MRLVELGVLYGVVGVGAAVAVLVTRRGGAADAALLLVLWPLYGPFVLLSPAPRQAVLAGLLPEPGAVRALEERVAVASARVAEIDRLLERPEFSEEDAGRRAKGGGSETAVTTASMRLCNIQRLKRMRERSARELEEVSELLKQLTTQAEVLRLASAAGESQGELARELQTRVAGLDQMLDEIAEDLTWRPSS